MAEIKYITCDEIFLNSEPNLSFEQVIETHLNEINNRVIDPYVLRQEENISFLRGHLIS